jgi:hypothetical protein
MQGLFHTQRTSFSVCLIDANGTEYNDGMEKTRFIEKTGCPETPYAR